MWSLRILKDFFSNKKNITTPIPKINTKKKNFVGNFGNYQVPKYSRQEYDLYKEFLDEIGGEKQENIRFRPGAIFTSAFGIDSNRYKQIDGKIVWGYPGEHLGVDRAGGLTKTINGEKINGVVICPFNFGSSGFVDYGGHGYGSIVYLYHKMGFCLRICHMFPNEILIKDELQKGYAIKMGTVIGPNGTYGFSTGRHTHVEIEAWGYHGNWLNETPVLDILLDNKYGEAARQPFTDEEVCEIYKSSEKAKDWHDANMIDNFKGIMKIIGAYWANKHKIVFKDNYGRLTTFYNSQSLFGM
jgi:murein DD-endopeptidase MepM/ murein hydrolase activator NlpD